MLALKITVYIFIGIFVITGILMGLLYKIRKNQILKNDLLTDEGKATLYRDLKRSNPIHYLCSWCIDFGIVYLIVFIILKIVK